MRGAAVVLANSAELSDLSRDGAVDHLSGDLRRAELDVDLGRVDGGGSDARRKRTAGRVARHPGRGRAGHRHRGPRFRHRAALGARGPRRRERELRHRRSRDDRCLRSRHARRRDHRRQPRAGQRRRAGVCRRHRARREARQRQGARRRRQRLHERRHRRHRMGRRQPRALQHPRHQSVARPSGDGSLRHRPAVRSGQPGGAGRDCRGRRRRQHRERHPTAAPSWVAFRRPGTLPMRSPSAR